MRSYRVHNAERSESIEGIPLASFRARAAAFAVDLLVTPIPAIAVTERTNSARLSRKLAKPEEDRPGPAPLSGDDAQAPLPQR